MNIISKFTIATVIIGSVITVSAQKADSKSKSILDEIARNYKSKKNTYFKFIYGTGENGKISKSKTGTFYTTPTQYKLKIMGIEQIFDGNKVYNISEEDHEVTITKASDSEMMLSPTNYLESYKKDFNASYVGKRMINGVYSDLIKLTPISNNRIKLVYLYINQPKKQILKIEQYATNSNVAVIEVKDYKENQTLDNNMFSFNKNNYKNYIITEL